MRPDHGGTANYYGGQNPERYVPMGISGVTIGTGVDLGQTDAATLGGMGVNSGTVNQLRPYLGQRKAAAVAVLHRLPLTLRQDVADDLDAAMLNHHVAKIFGYYDRAVGVPGMFSRLPWQAQAVIVSISVPTRGQQPAPNIPIPGKRLSLRTGPTRRTASRTSVCGAATNAAVASKASCWRSCCDPLGCRRSGRADQRRAVGLASRQLVALGLLAGS